MKQSTTLLAFLLAAMLAAAPAAAQDARPNVLFIAVDDLNDWVGCLGGHPQARTPNIDRLAARGMLFTNAHCAAPLCNPSRTSVMTGLMPSTSGVHGNQQDWRKSPYAQGKPTLPQYFKSQGYWTGGCGKLFHANHGGECGALNGGHGGLRGFNQPEAWTERFPSKDRQLAKPAVMPGQNFNGLDIWHWDWGPIDVPLETTSDGRASDWAVAKLRERREGPFFLGVGIYKPHGPWYAPRKYFEMHPVDRVVLPKLKPDDLDDVPEIAKSYLRNPNNFHAQILEHDLYHEAVQAYLANITFADAMVGKVLDALETSPHAKNTIVCLWSDHGWHLGEKQKWHKSTLWEEATRVPLIVVAPGVTRPGQRCGRPVSLVDLYPTLVELCGLKAPQHLDGLSLVPQLKDPESPRKRPAVTTRAGRHHSVRSERWRYIRYSDSSEELYDHSRDPDEYTNLTSDALYADVKRDLARWIPQDVRRVEEPSDAHQEAGFRPIFNGYDLTSWEGDTKRWSVVDGVITGRTTAEKPLEQNTFLIWRGMPQLADFELRLEFRIAGTGGRANSGVQYRSRQLKDQGPFVLAGYQADIDLGKKYLGILYEERGRGILALRGQKVELAPPAAPPGRRPGVTRRVLDSLGDPAALVADVDPGEWNDLWILARGNRVVQRLNGRVTIDVTDTDEKARSRQGLIGLQLHRGPPMQVQFRNLRLKDFAVRK